jgi:hypothetical protein
MHEAVVKMAGTGFFSGAGPEEASICGAACPWLEAHHAAAAWPGSHSDRPFRTSRGRRSLFDLLVVEVIFHHLALAREHGLQGL